MNRHRALLVGALVALVVLAGCVTPPAAVDTGARLEPEPWPADPPADTLGWEDGRWSNESLAIDQADGLNDSELHAFVARAKARVERIRGLEFTEPVPVRVISRDEYRADSGDISPPESADAFRNQVWEALFLVDEETDVNAAFAGVYGSSVQGYYSSGSGDIVIVSDSPDELRVDRGTLVHELVHALQDQHLGLETRGSSSDETRARLGATEGDANYVQFRYDERCEAEWTCVETPASERQDGREFNMGVFVTLFEPYSEGPTFVRTLRERGGWELVNEVIRTRHPASTEQTIHPEKFFADQPREVPVPDRSGPGWSRLTNVSEHPWDTVGEASLYATFWANGVIPRDHLFGDDDPDSRYNYSHPITAGWDGDRVIPYQSDDGEHGYVFASVWDSERDATQFREAYVQLLVEGHDATEVREGVYRVPESDSFDDAFRIRQEGDRVVIVNAPNVEVLDEVHAER